MTDATSDTPAEVGVWRSYHPDGSLKQEKDHGPAPDAAAGPSRA